MSSENFGDYEVIEDIGRGSTSRVVRARKDNSEYAIKIFDRFTSTLDFDIHHKEYSILGKLDHPSIVQVHDFGKMNGHSYIVMDLVTGRNMNDLVEMRGTLERGEMLKIAKDISSALDYSRKHGVVHGDVKPSNILVDNSGSAKLGDFGLARISPPLEHMTPVAGQPTSLGTTDFMAPEVLNDGLATWSSDLYSLGIVIYYGFSGRLPSDGRTIFSRSRDRVEGKLVPLSSRNPLVSNTLESAIQKALAVDPKERYDSCEVFYAAMVASETSSQHRQSWSPKKEKDFKRFDYYRYIIVPIVVAAIGAIAAIAKFFFG